MSAALPYLGAALALALALWLRAGLRCHREVTAMRTAARRRWDAARAVELVRIRWEQRTARLAAALAVVEATTPAPPVGFGDHLVAEERLALVHAAVQDPT